MIYKVGQTSFHANFRHHFYVKQEEKENKKGENSFRFDVRVINYPPVYRNVAGALKSRKINYIRACALYTLCGTKIRVQSV